MDIFLDSEYRVKRVVQSTTRAYPASVRLKLDNNQYLDEADFAVITGISFSAAANYQMEPSLDDVIYLFAFGDKPTEITITGIAFPELCDGGKVGIAQFFQFYRNNKITLKQSTIPQVQVNMAGEVLTGFLVGMELTIDDPATRIAKFRMSLVSAAV